jgi:1-acyl-sn-glycerol-3-phosphate acyltransferase
VNSVKAVAIFVVYGIELMIKRPKTRRAGAVWLHRFAKLILRTFGVTVTVEGRFPSAGVLISDHLSYLDIIVYAAISPVVYCSKAEVEHMPLLGFMAMSAGTVMVDRGSGGSADRAKTGMQAAEAEGIPVVFFPEGTTTTGYSLLPFKTGLLAVSLEAEQPIRAAFIRYSIEEDNGPGVSLHDEVCWGTTPMLTHIFRFVGLKGVHACVTIAPQPIPFSAAAESDRKQAAIEAREAVLALSGSWYPAEARQANAVETELGVS